AEDLARAIGDPTVRIAAFDESQPGLRRFFSQLATYLGLVGLASLLVGGVGIASSVTTFLRRQLATIAILKCLGAGSRVLLAAYLVQTQAVGALGSLVGAGLGVAILAALAIWQAGSFRLGAIFVGAAAVAIGVLLGLSRILVVATRRLPRVRGLAWRQGLAGLDRPGGHTVRVVVALGIGAMLLVAIALLEANLGRQIAYEQKRDAPAFFFIDVQPD